MIASVDVGGTFTDIVAVDESGVKIYKGPTTPKAPEQGVLQGMARLGRVTTVVHATTIGTNSLLGQVNLELPKVALLTTKGFKDVIEIGSRTGPSFTTLSSGSPLPWFPQSSGSR